MKKLSSLFTLVILFSIFAYKPVKEYKSVKIGDQIWMAENLDVAAFSNGDPISQAITPEEWIRYAKNGEAAWCYYENDKANKKYGKLYNWYAAGDPRGLAPEGWRVATDKDWKMLSETIDDDEQIGKILKGKEEWFENGNGTDEYGFSALPTGGRGGDGNFFLKSKSTAFWTSTDLEDDGLWTYGDNVVDVAWSRGLSFDRDIMVRNSNPKYLGLSVRCVKVNESDE